MQLKQALETFTAALTKAGIASARLDCLILFEDVLGHTRAHLLAHPDMPLTDEQLAILNTYITQRSQHIPLAYIRGRVAFFGRDFHVSPAVLVPRPETEVMIELLLTAKPTLPAKPHIIDIGTGSGCIGITAALELPEATVTLSDIDAGALAIATTNAQKLGASNVHFVQQDLLGTPHQPIDVILANLPYVPQDYPVNQAARHEPTIALYSGDDGLDAYRQFWEQVSALTVKPTHIFTESLLFQHKPMAHLARKAGYALDETQDLIQHFGSL